MLKIRTEQTVGILKIAISIFEDDDGGPYMKVIKRFSFAAETIEPARIVQNVNFGLHLEAQDAYRASEWYRIAAKTADTLDVIFKTREDLARPVSVRMVANTVTITFLD